MLRAHFDPRRWRWLIDRVERLIAVIVYRWFKRRCATEEDRIMLRIGARNQARWTVEFIGGRPPSAMGPMFHKDGP